MEHFADPRIDPGTNYFGEGLESDLAIDRPGSNPSKMVSAILSDLQSDAVFSIRMF
jgi:hypothetical protein